MRVQILFIFRYSVCNELIPKHPTPTPSTLFTIFTFLDCQKNRQRERKKETNKAKKSVKDASIQYFIMYRIW